VLIFDLRGEEETAKKTAGRYETKAVDVFWVSERSFRPSRWDEDGDFLIQGYQSPKFR
jgi:hypothetical protein